MTGRPDPADIPYFDLPLNLPHAATVADRILKLLGQSDTVRRRTRETAASIASRLMFYRNDDDNPPEPEAGIAREECLALARELVDHIERDGLKRDRLGQCVRNLFECLGEGREGALLSLRAGEDPGSAQRPWRQPEAGN